MRIKNINGTNAYSGFNTVEKRKQNTQIAFGSLSTTIANIGNKLTKSSAHFSDYNIRKDKLNILLGDEFTKMEDELRGLSSKIFNFDKRIIFDDLGGVTFVDDGILPKFLKSALYPFKDLWLDISCWALKGLSKISLFSDFANNALGTKVLSNRIKTSEAEEIFCIMQGAFSDIAKDEKAALKLRDKLTREIVQRASSPISSEVLDTPQIVVNNLLHAASNVKGNYKTADERTFNRLCTGMVSAVMAGIDFYNISRMQNDNDELAKKSQKKRLKQESSRILMSAGMTFLTLGALSKFVNANKYIALFTIAGTTLISEILSRIFNGMPLRPLKPEEAKDFAYHKHEKELKKQQKRNKAPIKTDSTMSLAELPKTFSAFSLQQKNVDNKTGFKGKNLENKKESNILNVKNILRAAGVLLVGGLAISFARSRNDKFNTLLKNIDTGMQDAYNLFTKKDYWVPADNVKNMLNNISDNYGMEHVAQRFREAIDSDKYAKVVHNINGNDVEMINLGKVDKKIIAPVIKAITYPFGFLWGVARFPVKTVQSLFNQEAAKDLSKVTSQDIISLYNMYNKAEKKLNAGKMSIAEFDKFIKRKVLIGAENKTGKSTYKNSSLAAISRPLVTLIASYFFVNDYKNEVLITSHGKDVEGADAVAKERIMHKVSNFFFNTLLMNLFNSVFETAYHGSLLGAGAVAAATEITNETLIRKSIGVPTRKMTRDEIIEHDKNNLERDDFWGKYFRFMSKLTGKKTISQKVQDQEKKKAQKA